MSNCTCEPHDQGSNRCRACKYEMSQAAADERESSRFQSALDFIRKAAVGGFPGGSVQVNADTWLEKHGYESGRALIARRQREARAAELDAEIERLRAERAKL